MPKLFSSRQIVIVLISEGFVFISRRGSHSKYRKNGRSVIVPADRKEIPFGTFKSILRQSGLCEDVFLFYKF